MSELIFFSMFALVDRGARGERLLHHHVSLRSHTIVAIAMTASRGLTIWALLFLNYPTHVCYIT
jgi:hypothetical protein